MKNLSLGILILVTLLPWSAPVLAQGRFGGHFMMGDGPGMMSPLVLKKLNLTDDQKTQARIIMEAHRQTLQTLFQQSETAREAMADQFYAAGDLTTADFTSQTQQINQWQAQIMAEGLKTSLAIRAILTPEQLTQAAQIKDQIRAMHAQMHRLFEQP
jgi:Spy/CpxP family protein refolding chaperone